MKRIYGILFWAFALALTACKDDQTDGTYEFRFTEPQVSEVTGTTASIACSAPQSEALLAALTPGFAYGTEAEDTEDYLITTECLVEGNRITARLTGLLPEKNYRVFAFLDNGGGQRLTGPAVAFTTAAIGADETVLEITSQAKMVVPSEAESYTITYEIINPDDEAAAEARSESTWVHSFVGSDPVSAVSAEGAPRLRGRIDFSVDANPGDARTAVITVTYPGVSDRRVIVEQEAAAGGGTDEETRVIELSETNDWPDHSYAAATKRFGDSDYSMSQVGDYGNGIQFKSGSGWLANEDDMGVIRKIELVYGGKTVDKNMVLFLGDQPRPESHRLEARSVEGTYTYDCSSEGDFRYFKLLNGSGASYLTSIKIYCGGPGGDVPPPSPVDKPRFGMPVYEDLTKNSVSLSCSFTYSGEETVSEAYFLYKTSTGTEQRVSADGTQSPVSATLSGLTPSTFYSFALCLEIGGETYKSAYETFITLTESGENPDPLPDTGTRYAGWPELPVEVSKKGDYYYAYHMRADAPTIRNFSVCYSKDYECPVWVAAPMHTSYTGGSGRNDAYRQDPVLMQQGCSQVQKRTGYSRGHMLGSSDRTVSVATNKQVFYNSNIGPQLTEGFNQGQGVWNNLEEFVDDKWCADTLYQVIGCYWENTSKHASGTTIPTHYYKLLLRTKKGNTRKAVRNCTADELQCVGFLVEHNSSQKFTKPNRQMMRSVAEIERMTGFKFFSNVPNAPKDAYNPSDWGL